MDDLTWRRVTTGRVIYHGNLSSKGAACGHTDVLQCLHRQQPTFLLPNDSVDILKKNPCSKGIHFPVEVPLILWITDQIALPQGILFPKASAGIRWRGSVFSGRLVLLGHTAVRVICVFLFCSVSLDAPSEEQPTHRCQPAPGMALAVPAPAGANRY